MRSWQEWSLADGIFGGSGLQPLVELLVCQGIRQWPAQSGYFGTAQIIADGSAGYVQTAGDGTLPQLAVKVKTECFSDFAHG